MTVHGLLKIPAPGKEVRDIKPHKHCNTHIYGNFSLISQFGWLFDIYRGVGRRIGEKTSLPPIFKFVSWVLFYPHLHRYKMTIPNTLYLFLAMLVSGTVEITNRHDLLEQS